MAEDKGKKTAESDKQQEDPEEVAAREAGHEPEAEKADKKILRENAKAEEEASTDEDGEQVDPAVHVPHVQKARKRKA